MMTWTLVEHVLLAGFFFATIVKAIEARDLRRLADKYRAAGEERRSDILRWCIYKCPHKDPCKSLDGTESDQI